MSIYYVCAHAFGFVGDSIIHQNIVMHYMRTYFATQCAYMWKTDGAVRVVLKLDSNEGDVSIKQKECLGGGNRATVLCKYHM